MISEGAKMLMADPSILLRIEADQTATAEHKLGYFQAAAEAIDALNGRVHEALAANNRATTALHHTIQTQALELITARGEAEEAHRDAQRFKQELLNIADAKRFKRDVFETDTEWADWAQSRASYVSSGDAAADQQHKGKLDE